MMARTIKAMGSRLSLPLLWRILSLVAVILFVVFALCERHALPDRFIDDRPGFEPQLVEIEATSFIMGAPPDHPGYRRGTFEHRVVLSAYAIGMYEVTIGEFIEFLNDDAIPPKRLRSYLAPPLIAALTDSKGHFYVSADERNLPITGVSWSGALAYTEWLSQKTGFHYTLPSEAEWEYAARLGSGKANCNNEYDTPLPVQETNDGGSGPHGMIGNVWEWTRDCFRMDNYERAADTDPQFFDENCLTPAIRGGSFRDADDLCNNRYRSNYFWTGHMDGIGFRVVRKKELTQ